MKIRQECFKTLKDLNNKAQFRKGNNNPGVYMWGFSLEETEYTIPSNSQKFFPYYVGKVQKDNGCMYGRTQEHLGSIMGGNSSIFNIISFYNKLPISPTSIGMRNTKTPIGIGTIHSNYQKASKKGKKNGAVGPRFPDSNFPDLLHFPEGIHRMFEFTNDKQIKGQIDWMLKHFCITFFTLEKYNKQEIIDLEKFIGNKVGYHNLITKRYSDPALNVEIICKSGDIKINEFEDFFRCCSEQVL